MTTPGPTTRQTDPVTGLQRVDISGNRRIPVLMEMVGALSQARGPREVLRVFSNREELYGPRGYVSISTRGLPAGHYRVTDVLDLSGSYDIVTADPMLRPEPQLPINKGGFFGKLICSAQPELYHNVNIADDPVVGTALAGWGSMMSIPLYDTGVPVTWTVFLRREPDGFTVTDLEAAILRVNLVGTAIKNAIIAGELFKAHERIRSEVENIAAIQRALLPTPIPDIPGLQIAASYQTFDQAGGDYYDFRPLRLLADNVTPDITGPWGMLIGDASGHGPAAAVVMAMLHAIIHAYPEGDPEGPSQILQHANAHLASKRIENSFVTAFLGVYDPLSRRLTYARAGHNPPLVRAENGEVRRLDDVGGIPLGVLDPTDYEESSVELQPGQTLLLYTDGITEARAPDGAMFGIGRVEEAFASSDGEPHGVLQSITEPITRHTHGRQSGDDQTIVAIRSAQ